MPNRGTARNSKGGTPRPKRPKKGTLARWALDELDTIKPLLKVGEDYLADELERLKAEHGNSPKVIAILTHLWKRQERARQIKDHEDRLGEAQAAKPPEANGGDPPGRYDLSLLGD